MSKEELYMKNKNMLNSTYGLNRAVYGVWQNDLKNNMSDDSIVYMDTDSCKYRYRNEIHEHIFAYFDNWEESEAE